MKRVLKKEIVIFICIALLLSKNIVVQAQKGELAYFETSTPKTMALGKRSDELLSKKFKAYEVAAFPVEELGKFLNTNNNIESEFQIKLANKVYEINLQQSKIIASNYKLTIQEPVGMRTIQQAPDNIFYKGFANNDKTNTVRLTLKEGLISGYIQQDGKEIFVESLTNYIPTAAPNDVVIYNTPDAITTENNTCGVTERTGMIERATAQQKLEANRETLTGVCKKLKFVFITDYSMFEYFNGDIAAMQNKMLATLNNAQGIYTGLNFGTDVSVDEGTDELNFELTHFHVATCKDCDIFPQTMEVMFATSELAIRNWIKANTDTSSLLFSIYNTRRELRLLSPPNSLVLGYALDQVYNCTTTKSPLMVCSYRLNAIVDRYIAAHELGHILGCVHDNFVKPSVTNYIMNSSININSTTFSTLANFQGIIFNGGPFSSKLSINNSIRQLNNCISECDNNICAVVENLNIQKFVSGDSALVTWQGVQGMYKIILRDAGNNVQQHTIVGGLNSSYVIKGLQSCKYYVAEVQNACGNKSSATFSTSFFENVSPKIINERIDLYDVEVNIADNLSLGAVNIRATIDHTTKWNSTVSLPNKLLLKNLFSDGARHRIDLYISSSKLPCRTIYYKAPYYRKDAITLALADFNNCSMTNGWKDSVLTTGGYTPPYVFTPRWGYKDEFKISTGVPSGSLDSSCLIYYDNTVPYYSNCAGSINLTSPEIDVSKLTSKMLSFDYKYIFKAYPVRQPIFKIEAFDGQAWKIIFNAQPTAPLTNSNAPTFWDTLPPRKFIPLDSFYNVNFKLRFTVNDFSFNTNIIRQLFVLLDNIKIDGYLNADAKVNNGLLLFPNPTQNELFIRINRQAEQPTTYKILDARGRILENKQLINYRIDLSHLSSALYFIQFYFKDNTKRIETHRFIKI